MKNLVLHFIKCSALLVVLASQAIAQTTIAGFEVNGLSNYGPPSLAASTTGPNITVGDLSRGSGLTTTNPSGAAANAFGATGWDGNTSVSAAVAAGDFFFFTVTPSQAAISFATFQFNYRRSGTGPAAGQLQYSTNGSTFVDVASGAYSYSSASSGGSVSTVLTGETALQNVASGTTVTFRIINYNATGASGTFYINNGGGEDLVVSSPVPLSTDLLSFTANTSGRTAKFLWTTSCASTTKTFTVEHSPEGQSFTEAGRVDATTSECSDATRTYGFETPARNGLYRLAMHDASGRTSYSRALSIAAETSAGSIRLYPSPAENMLQVEGVQVGSPCSIVDAAGRTVMSWTASSKTENVAVGTLPAGMYLLVAEAAGSRVTQRFSKN